MLVNSILHISVIIPFPLGLSAAPVGSASGAVRPPREAGGAPTGARPSRQWAANPPIYFSHPLLLYLIPAVYFFFRNFLIFFSYSITGVSGGALCALKPVNDSNPVFSVLLARATVQ